MKTSQQINLEKLTKAHRDELGALAWENWRTLRRIEHIAQDYEGRIHTRLDKVRCALEEANEALGALGLNGAGGELV